MKLFGQRSWYLPRRLEWLPRVEARGAVGGLEAKPVPASA
jgi:hypothetical protein